MRRAGGCVGIGTKGRWTRNFIASGTQARKFRHQLHAWAASNVSRAASGPPSRTLPWPSCSCPRLGSLPFDGTVIAAPVSVGDVVARASKIGTVFQNGRLETRAPIPVADLAYLGDPRGRPAAVFDRGQRFDAVVAQVSSVLAPRTRLSMLLLDFADANAPPPGTFVRVTVEGPAFDNAYLLPSEAHRAGDSVWVVADGELVRETPRTLGQTEAGWIVAEFDARDGVVLGAVPGERAGLAVTAVAEGGGR